MFRTRNHNIFRFVLDIILLLILFGLIVLPVYLTFTLKISGTDLKALGVEKVAGTSNSR